MENELKKEYQEFVARLLQEQIERLRNLNK